MKDLYNAKPLNIALKRWQRQELERAARKKRDFLSAWARKVLIREATKENTGK